MDRTKMSKEQLIEQLDARDDQRPSHVHSDGTVCRSPYCLSLYDPAPPEPSIPKVARA